MRKDIATNDQWGFLSFSESRGHMHVLSPNGFAETDPAHVIANGGAQLMNAKVYEERYSNPDAGQIIGLNEYATTAVMLAYSRPGDTLVYAPNGHGDRSAVFKRIANSYARYGIEVARNYQEVELIDDIQVDPPLIPNIISPTIAAYFGENGHADPNVRYYNKHIHQRLWEETGVPTPMTGYVDRSHQMSIERALQAAGDWKSYVINTVDGSGGYGIHFADKSEVGRIITSLMGDRNNDVVQIQGYIPLKSSPCIIGNLSDSGIEILLASEQYFKTPGAHSGNFWDKEMLQRLKQYEDDYQRAFATLWEEGVRSQINIDLLIPEVPTIGSDGNLHDVLAREVNIRPAGSSVLLRQQDATLRNDGSPDIIHTVSSTRVLDPDMIEHINDSTQKNLGIILYNYIETSQSASLAFLGNDICPDDFVKFKNDSLKRL